MRPRKILLVCPAGLVAGKEIVSLALARGLREKGFDPEIVTSSWGSEEFSNRLAEEGFKYHRLRLGFISMSLRWNLLEMTLTQLLYWPVLLYQYCRLVYRLAPDVIIHTNWHHALLLLPLLNTGRDIYWSHELASRSRSVSRVLRAIAKRVGFVVCVSRAAAESLQAVGVPNSKIAVIHNGVSSTAALPIGSTGAALRLGIVGQIGPWKGHDDLLEALGILSRGGTPFELRVFGTGAANYIEKLKLRASVLGIADKIEWYGFVRSQAEIFALIDVCVLPSRFPDPLPTSAIEAGAFGRPVICSGVGGLPEIVKHGKTGIIVEPSRPDQLADAILPFVRNPNLISEMGQAARSGAQEEFSNERFVRQFVDVFDTMSRADRAGLKHPLTAR